MADLFPSPFGNVADLYGEPAALRVQREAGRAAAAAQATKTDREDALLSRDQDARDQMANLYDSKLAQLQDPAAALKAFVTDPAFLSSPLHKDMPSMMQTIQSVTAGPKPQIVPEGGALVGEGGQPLFQNPGRPQTVAPGAALVDRSGQVLHNQPNPKVQNAFVTHADTKAVDRFSKLSEDGDNARQEAASLSQLRQALTTAPDAGALTTWRQVATQRFGIDVKDKTDIDVVGALVDKLTPRMRVPGSGATSDMEMRVFKNSLPNLMQSKAGRERVLANLEALVNERMRVGDIADDVLFNGISKQDALARIRGERPASMQAPQEGAPKRLRYNPATGKLE